MPATRNNLLPRLMLLGAALMSWSIAANAQTVLRPSFSMVGFVEELSVASLTDPLSAGSMTVNGIKITLPANLLITMPGQYLTLNDLFKGKHPTAAGAATRPSGLGIKDPVASRPRLPIEASVLGNVVNGEYMAGVVRFAQLGLQVGTGVISDINYPQGAMLVQSGPPGATVTTKVIINDPKGDYGKPNAAKFASGANHPIDERFSADPDNAPIRAETGYPMCLPLTSGGDADCPAVNRPPAGDANRDRFTCGAVAAESTSPAFATCDPNKKIPFVIGDYITYSGMLTEEAPDQFFVAAHAVVAMAGFYTSPGESVVYITIEEVLMGTSGFQDAAIPQEATGRIKFVGFTTDPSRNVTLASVEYHPTTGVATENLIATVTPQRLGQIGRLRIEIRPPKTAVAKIPRDVVIRATAFTPIAAVKRAGVYTAPVAEYIYPENTLFGRPNRPTSVPLDFFCFLKNGVGPLNTLGRTALTPVIGPLGGAAFPGGDRPGPQPLGAPVLNIDAVCPP